MNLVFLFCCAFLPHVNGFVQLFMWERYSKQFKKSHISSFVSKKHKWKTKEVCYQRSFFYTRTIRSPSLHCLAFMAVGTSILDQSILVDVSRRKVQQSGPKRVPLDLEPLCNVPFKNRTTLEDICMLTMLDISQSKLLRYIQEGQLVRHSNSIKPHLTDATRRLGYNGVWIYT